MYRIIIVIVLQSQSDDDLQPKPVTGFFISKSVVVVRCRRLQDLLVLYS